MTPLTYLPGMPTRPFRHRAAPVCQMRSRAPNARSLFAARSIFTSLGPPGTTASVFGKPGQAPTARPGHRRRRFAHRPSDRRGDRPSRSKHRRETASACHPRSPQQRSYGRRTRTGSSQTRGLGPRRSLPSPAEWERSPSSSETFSARIGIVFTAKARAASKKLVFMA